MSVTVADTGLAPPDGPVATAEAPAAAEAGILPKLRDDLELLPGPLDPDGARTWTLYDPARNRYFRLRRTAFEYLSRWRLGDAGRLLAAIARDTTVEADGETLEQMLFFVRSNHLVEVSGEEAREGLSRVAKAGRSNWLKWGVHNYLFIRIPLVRPDRFLDATEPLVRPLFSRHFLYACLALGAVGLLLAARQWEQFVATFLYFFTWEGAALYFLALVGTKLLHEAGHGYLAKRHGLRVPTMGLAFMVLWPVLYTDTTDGWRLIRRRPRLEIAAGGILVELVLACLATFAWVFLPDGPLRSAAFLVATVTWITTLVINLNPFMRFDGYYLFADSLGVANLQPRSFALGRWALREALFGFNRPPPERWPPRTRRLLIAYAYATWIYRFFLFLGIAILIYHFFIKVVGIALMIVELAWFIGLPIFNEVKAWVQHRSYLRWSWRPVMTLGVLLAGLAVLFVPWQDRLAAPATLEAAATANLYPPVAGQIVAGALVRGPTDGDLPLPMPVRSGDVLVRLEAPETMVQLDLATRRLAVLQLQIQRLAASQTDLDRLAVLERELATTLAEVRGLRRQVDRLTITAPFDGLVVDRAEGLDAGAWIAPTTRLASVIAAPPVVASPASMSGAGGAAAEAVRPGAGGDAPRDDGLYPLMSRAVEAFVPAREAGRLTVGATGRFLPDDPAAPALPVVLTALDPVAGDSLDNPYLASLFGGPIAVDPAPAEAGAAGRPDAPPGQAGERLVPRTGQVRLRLLLDADRLATLDLASLARLDADRVLRGVTFLDAEPRSIAGHLARGAMGVLIRESGF